MRSGRYEKKHTTGEECYTNKRLYYDPTSKMFWIASDETFSNFIVLDGIDVTISPKKQLGMLEYTYKIPDNYQELQWDSIMTLIGTVDQIQALNSIRKRRKDRYKLYFDGDKFYVGFYTDPERYGKQWYCFTPQMPFLDNENAKGYMAYREPRQEECVDLDTVRRLLKELLEDKEEDV